MPRVEIAFGEGALTALDDDWDRVWLQSPDATIFQHREWLTSWNRTAGVVEAQCPIVLKVWREGRLVLGMAMQIGELSGERCISGQSTPWADYHDAVGIEPGAEDLNAAASAILALSRTHSAPLRFTDIRRGGHLEAILARSSGTFTTSSQVSQVALSDSAHLKALQDRGEFRLKRRRLARLGQIEIIHHCDPRAVSEAFPRFMDLHLRQWSDRPDAVAPFTAPGVAEAFTALAANLAAGFVRITELRLSGQMIASYFGFVVGETYLAYRTAFDRLMFRYSPGHLMLMQMFEDLRGQGIRVFDFMRGAYGYKKEYSTTENTNIDWRCAPMGPAPASA
jgi:CelD/BcsL family acetyltransferase involved in cellulose biosynthesis